MRIRILFFASLSLCVAVGVACSGSSGIADPAITTNDASPTPATPVDAGATDASSDSTTGPSTLSFSFTPSWTGVQSVDVIGGFGQMNDWTTPLLSLTNDGTGKFTGTSPALPSGNYTYLFSVKGDDAAAPAKQAAYPRYAMDPTEASWAPCPDGSPTFSKTVANPCSQVAVPALAATPMFHVHGVVDSGSSPIAGYLVVIERDEMDSHHEFVNRTTTAADGTYDLSVAAGTYRLQVLHPTYESMTDAQRTDPASLAAVRRLISSSMAISADTEVNAPDVSFPDYAKMTPTGTSTLPTTFAFVVPKGAKSHAEVYGPGNTVGDPWWTAPAGTDTSDIFDGGFNTKQAPDDASVDPSKTYAWGVENIYAMPKNGVVSWTAQSMVFPIAWP